MHSWNREFEKPEEAKLSALLLKRNTAQMFSKFGDLSGPNLLSFYGTQRGFYLDVLACGVFAASQNVPEAPARARQCRPTGRRAQGIFGAEWPSTRPNEVVVRAAGKTCSLQ